MSRASLSVSQRLGNLVDIQRMRRPAFYAVTAAFLAFLVFALREPMAMALTGWTAEYAFPTHRVHHIMIGGMLTVFFLTVAVQLYRPIRQIGAIQAALTFVIVALVVTLIASGTAAAGELLIFAIPVTLIALLHPGVRRLLPDRSRVDLRLLALAAAGTVGFAVIAIGELVAHTSLANDHVAFGHYEFMSIVLISIGLFAFLGAFRPAGWRILIYAAAVLAALYAVASLAFPGAEQGSSLGVITALVVLGWAIGLIAVAEFVDRRGPKNTLEQVRGKTASDGRSE